MPESTGQASAGKGDVIIWSSKEGLFAGVAVSVTDINYDAEKTASYYGKRGVTARNVISGNQHSPQAQDLVSAMPGA